MNGKVLLSCTKSEKIRYIWHEKRIKISNILSQWKLNLKINPIIEKKQNERIINESRIQMLSRSCRILLHERFKSKLGKSPDGYMDERNFRNGNECDPLSFNPTISTSTIVKYHNTKFPDLFELHSYHFFISVCHFFTLALKLLPVLANSLKRSMPLKTFPYILIDNTSGLNYVKRHSRKWMGTFPNPIQQGIRFFVSL